MSRSSPHASPLRTSLARLLPWLVGQREPTSIADARAHKLSPHTSYQTLVDTLRADAPTPEKAMELAVGGQFQAYGILERNLLYASGLPANGYLIDVGCGSGRLASRLAEDWPGRYLGIDIIDDLLEHARAITGRKDWRFERGDGLVIPESDACADMVCFFSVFTHLLHEESYTYLREAVRVLVPGGRIVFSFLEFRIGKHWPIFAANVAGVRNRQVLNQFLSRDAIEAWASHLGLTVESLSDGDRPSIPLDEPLVLDDGRRIEQMAAFGQSVCVLRKTG